MDGLAARFHDGLRSSRGCSTAPPRRSRRRSRDRRVQRAPDPGGERGDGSRGGAAAPPRSSAWDPLRLAVDSRALPRARRLVSPRGRETRFIIIRRRGSVNRPLRCSNSRSTCTGATRSRPTGALELEGDAVERRRDGGRRHRGQRSYRGCRRPEPPGARPRRHAGRHASRSKGSARSCFRSCAPRWRERTDVRSERSRPGPIRRREPIAEVSERESGTSEQDLPLRRRRVARADRAGHRPDAAAAAAAGRRASVPRAGRRRLLHAGGEAAARIRGAGAQPRPRRGVHGARGQLQVRRRADGALRPHRGRGRQPYGFTAGPDGLSFLVVRQGAASFAAAPPSETLVATYDLIVRGGYVVDGTGLPRRRVDVGVRDGTIAALGRLDDDDAQEIDADGMIVAPGIVDVHTHYDPQITFDPYATVSASTVSPRWWRATAGSRWRRASPNHRVPLGDLRPRREHGPNRVARSRGTSS